MVATSGTGVSYTSSCRGGAGAAVPLLLLLALAFFMF